MQNTINGTVIYQWIKVQYQNFKTSRYMSDQYVFNNGFINFQFDITLIIVRKKLKIVVAHKIYG